MKKTTALLLLMMLLMTAQQALALTVTGVENESVSRLWETNKFFSRMEELTGIAATAHGVTEDEEYAKLLADMENGVVNADVLFKAELSREQEIALLDSGALIDLAPLIDEHMPNLSALLSANPEWREIIALEDGRIASLPQLNEKERQVVMWINRAWLETLGLQMPATLDELTAALTAIKNGDLNKNGKDDEIPVDLLGVYEMRWLLPYFGVVADDYSVARDSAGQLVFAPELPAYRDFIELLKDWYEQGLLNKNAFTNIHGSAVVEEKEENAPLVSGMLLSVTPYTHIPVNSVTNYEPLLLAGPDGQVRWRDLLGEVWPGCFAVTSRCEDPAQALKWADALFAEEAALLAYAGVEGEDYELNADGTWLFKVDMFRDMSSIRSEVLIYTGAMMPGLYPADFIHRVDSEVDRHVFAASEKVHAVSEQVTAPYCLNEADRARANELALTLVGMVDRGIARFVTGEIELSDETYAAWIAQMQEAGSGELVALFAGAE